MTAINRNKLIVSAVFFGISFLLYGNSLGGGFVLDDKLAILQNPLVDGSFSNFFRAFFSPYYYNQPHAGLYRPLVIASYNLNRFFSSGPLGFHLLNVILNAVNGFLVFLLVSKLISRYVTTSDVVTYKKTAYIAGILFMFLPIHSEAVSANAGRAELLMFLFSILSFLFILDKRHWTASLFLLFGLLSKETAAGFFLVFLYVWKFGENKTAKQVVAGSLYFVPAIAVYAIMRASVLGEYFASVDYLMAYNPLKFVSFFDGLWTSFKVFYLYLSKTFIPIRFSSDYSFNQIPTVHNPFMSYEAMAGVFILAVLVYAAVKRRNDVYGLSAAVFLFTFLPVSNWFVKIGTIMGERLMYAPSLALAIIGAGTAKFKILNMPSFRTVRYVLLAMLFAWYGYLIIDRNLDWRDEASIITSAYWASPNSVVSLTNMAFLSFGDDEYREAAGWAEKALDILPDHLPALFLAGHAYKKTGDLKTPETYWLKVLELNPNYPPVYLSLGVLYYEQERLAEAENILENGFNLEKTWGKLFPLALVKINLGKYDEAAGLIIVNFGSNPEKRELRFALGLAYLKTGDRQKAEFYLSQVKDPSMKIEDYFKQVANQKVFKISEY